ncbi:DUF4181 domain-containing protein [Planococcus sp. CP5-4]|uniref:DUF4181 domain-containing protein n=1 Tax=unclassified Planococcus (in: firmicutes) TaxID=2662419 RepID=UPI001C24FAE0|nr:MULTISPECIES: DUF4181 domain-containing protein [unclassified Planococcus (in: firmicutes)]MBU9674441.1 DUF4181 domain-containing protein [Planococcus sp. CP5-4_YE]MBV0909731.1 DUF4181 domain-containing protein [Planococcus sp. CP5-4_UN]MBW6064720.1 DUF4181 domain-containing protein [Planococcus sp. CP5-4]
MFWLEIGLLILGIFLLNLLMNFILRKLLKIEKEKKDFFSSDYVNERHGAIDKWLRRLWLLLSSIAIYLVFIQAFPVLLYLMLFVVLMASDAFVRAYFEWKHSNQPKLAILTLSELVVWTSAVTFVIYFDVFNLLTLV